MPKVEDVSIWLNPLRLCACSSPCSSHSLCTSVSPSSYPTFLPHFKEQTTPSPLLLSHPTPDPKRLSAAWCTRAPSSCSPSRDVLSHSFFPALARKWGIRKAKKAVRFGEQEYAVVSFLVVRVWGVVSARFEIFAYAAGDPSFMHFRPLPSSFALIPFLPYTLLLSFPPPLLSTPPLFTPSSPSPPQGLPPQSLYGALPARQALDVWIVHRRRSILTRSSFLQRRVLFILRRVLFYGASYFSSAHARSCVN
ncbi:hypothetical protein B0H13DRAFT_2359689 [Mycena leptocephala]|nr:hypothetical protein B0H13DRAFT_2359689 [Mycena leptocephala]